MQVLREYGARCETFSLPAPAKLCFLSFGTAGRPDLAQFEQAYYELTLVQSGHCPQIGWAEPGFTPRGGCGVGDDAKSWGADGIRQALWHDGELAWSVQWKSGDVIGCAVDVKQGTVWLACNGEWQIVFKDCQWSQGVYPAMSGSMMAFALNWPPKFGGPTPDFGCLAFDNSLHSLLDDKGTFLTQ